MNIFFFLYCNVPSWNFTASQFLCWGLPLILAIVLMWNTLRNTAIYDQSTNFIANPDPPERPHARCWNRSPGESRTEPLQSVAATCGVWYLSARSVCKRKENAVYNKSLWVGSSGIASRTRKHIEIYKQLYKQSFYWNKNKYYSLNLKKNSICAIVSCILEWPVAWILSPRPSDLRWLIAFGEPTEHSWGYCRLQCVRFS